MMDDTKKFTRTVLKKIALARVLCSDADFYILDSPFNDIDDSLGQLIEWRLRELQKKNKTVVLSLKHLDKYTALEDHIIIL
jgi:manganese/zinc/iron transport system ATP- binding protein